MQSKKDRAEVYEYYRGILSYPERYSAIYGTVREINKPSDDSIDVEIQPPGEKPSKYNPFTTRFTFFPQNEIRYEVINGYGKGEIKNSIVIKEASNHALRKGCKCEVEVNHLPLDIMKLDPQLLDPSKSLNMIYIEMVSYFSIQDRIHLEGDGSLDEVRDCPNCGEAKSVSRIGKVETNENGRKKTIWLKCEKCGKEFRDLFIATNNGVDLNG